MYVKKWPVSVYELWVLQMNYLHETEFLLIFINLYKSNSDYSDSEYDHISVVPFRMELKAMV